MFTVGTTASSDGAGERLQVSVWRRGEERSRGLGDSNRRPDIASHRRCPFIPGAASPTAVVCLGKKIRRGHAPSCRNVARKKKQISVGDHR